MLRKFALRPEPTSSETVKINWRLPSRDNWRTFQFLADHYLRTWQSPPKHFNRLTVVWIGYIQKGLSLADTKISLPACRFRIRLIASDIIEWARYSRTFDVLEVRTVHRSTFFKLLLKNFALHRNMKYSMPDEDQPLAFLALISFKGLKSICNLKSPTKICENTQRNP